MRDLSFCSGAVIQKKGVETRVFLFLFQFSITQLVTASPPNFTRLIPSLEMTLETRHFQEPSRKERLEITNNARKKHSKANGEDGGCDSENNLIMHNANSEIEAIYCFKICSNSTRRGASYG